MNTNMKTYKELQNQEEKLMKELDEIQEKLFFYDAKQIIECAKDYINKYYKYVQGDTVRYYKIKSVTQNVIAEIIVEFLEIYFIKNYNSTRYYTDVNISLDDFNTYIVKCGVEIPQQEFETVINSYKQSLLQVIKY